jgi:hypothetical protein
MDVPRPSSETLVKILSASFAALIAPVVTGVAIWWIQKKLDDAPAAPQPAATTADADKDKDKDKAGTADGSKGTTDKAIVVASTGSAVPSPSAPAVTKRRRTGVPIRLFNGADLTGFETYLGSLGAKKAPLGLNNDPEKVFSAQRGELHISGKTVGVIQTVKEYSNYHLTMEYHWGERRWAPRAELPRLSGLILHAFGPGGSIHGWSVAGVLCSVGEIETGALSVPDTPLKPLVLNAEVETVELGKNDRTLFIYKPGSPTTTVKTGAVHSMGFRPASARGIAKAAAASAGATGESHTLEVVCEGTNITVTRDGKLVNQARVSGLTRGKIAIESQGAELVIRKLEIELLDAPPAPAAASKKGRS